ncbi:MAG: histidine kinase [Desulfobacterales bacterium]|nr:MAG: histidine kinase [Desulfobacterales bacterium]
MAKILIADDEEKMRHLLSLMLQRDGHEILQAGDGAAALERLRDEGADMLISDMKMPRMDGMSLLAAVREASLPVPVIFITAFATVDSAVDAMKAGAADYITKPFEEDRIRLTVRRAEQMAGMMKENRDLKRRLKKAEGGHPIIHRSKVMAELMALADRVAETDAAVLIAGESGTGKELLARYIHDHSARRGGRFVPVNCAAITPGLVEAELFGHEKGSFTGADRRKEGKFEYASGGTLFLDEIGDLPLEAQAKLLRALQEKKVQRVGGNEEIPVDVRVVCATNRQLTERVEEGEFRQDLYYRVNVFPLQPPPLRDRMADVRLLTEFFLKRAGVADAAVLTDSAVKALTAYDWPGNVRELANAVERAVILAGPGNSVTADTFSFLRTPGARCARCDLFTLPPGGLSLEEMENSLTRQALEAAGNNQTAAAKLLGLTRAKYRVLMKQAGI